MKENKPAFHLYHVKDGAGDKGIWTKVGAAWPHKDGKGYDLKIDVLFNIRLVAREPMDKLKEE